MRNLPALIETAAKTCALFQQYFPHTVVLSIEPAEEENQKSILREHKRDESTRGASGCAVSLTNYKRGNGYGIPKRRGSR